MTKQDDGFVKEITSKEEDFSRWYVDVIRKAELADYSSIKGCMVIKPYGYELWENIKNDLDNKIKDTGHKNAYFPLFVPESLLKKEAEHVEGFAPEVAWITHGGDDELEERIAIRPTSEAIIGDTFSQWIESWRDLPLLINQWANVVRWEKVTRLFLRTREFLWQEGHTAHATQQEAEEETMKMLGVYQELCEKVLAMPVIPGRKTENQKFPGALHTYTVEALMSNGWALQAGTSHNLGQHFARVFDIQYLDQNQEQQYVWQTSWGVSTRLVGGVIMTHGDDSGLILPPAIAPLHAVIVPILFDKTRDIVLEKVDQLLNTLSGKIRVEADTRDEYTPGWKFNEWEMKGVPVRIEVGPRDVKNQQVVLVRRDNREKIIVKENNLLDEIQKNLEDIQSGLFQKALDFRTENTYEVDNFKDFEDIMAGGRGFIYANWCGSSECEDEVQNLTKATIRCIPLEGYKPTGECVHCSKEGKYKVYFAKAY
ncbi:proline--tRNA ligase [Candidatus Poribacteria bacterium]|nr:proline--tRNA ligase [Candidatus Poribacteria bacterium]